MKNIDPQEPLEQFIDDALKGLPNLKAPPRLLGKVMSRINLQPVAWWQSGWACWPLTMRVLSVAAFCGLAMVCARGISQMWSSQFTTQLLARAGQLPGSVFGFLHSVNVPPPLKVCLLLCPLGVLILSLIAPVVVGGIRAVCVLTLNKYEE
jgi:hypothetical protein